MSQLVLALLLGLFTVQDGEQPEPKQDEGTDFRFFWKDGIYFESDDQSFLGQMGGRILYDSIFQNADSAYEASAGEPAGDESHPRSSRFFIKGEVNERWAFKLEMDFVGGSAGYRDVYVKIKDFPFSNTTIGHFKEPYSLEGNTSLLDLVFMERGYTDAFNPRRNFGAMVNGTGSEGMMTYAFGWFRDSDDFAAQDSPTAEGDSGFTTRFTWLPLYNHDTHTLVHVGASASVRSPAENDFLSAVPVELDTSLTPVSQDTPLATDRQTIINLEVALLIGNVTIQSGYSRMTLDLPTGSLESSVDLDASFVSISVFLTGEQRPYDMETGGWGRVEPKTSVFGEGDEDGPGAIELAIRYSMIDYNDLIPLGLGGGGALDNLTVGLNWYLTSHFRITVNLIESELDDTSIKEDGKHAGVRFGFWF